MDVERARPGTQHDVGLPARPRHVLRLARGARPRSAHGSVRRPRRVRRRAQIERCRDVERRQATRRDPHGPPAPRRRAPPPRRPDDRSRGRPGAVGDPQAADRGSGHEAARAGRGQLAAAPPRSRPVGAPLCDRGADLRGGRPLDGRHRLRRAPRAALRQGREGAHRAVRRGGGDRRSTHGSPKTAGASWCHANGSGATMPRRCSSTCVVGGSAVRQHG